MSNHKKKSKNNLPDVDPYLEREAQKYENPIPSREYILNQLISISKPLTLPQIAELLRITDETRLEALRRRLHAMERDGQLIRNRRDGYGAAKQMNLIRGRVTAHPDGFGFLIPDEGGEDLFLSEKQMRSIIHGDRVLACIVGVDRRGRREGAVVEILERNTHQIVGRFFLKQGVAYVEPNNRRITHRVMIPTRDNLTVETGQIVTVELLEQPTKHEPPIGKIIEIIGEHLAPGMEIDIAIRSYNLPHEWSTEVQNEIKNLTPTISANAYQGRVDIRDLSLVTIDGDDSRDFDDAVYCEPRGKGWRLLVAIADVASYVKPNSALDKESRERGNSVYFPHRVIPMLPEILSNGLCSLNPQVDRLCLVCEMWIDSTGRNRRTQFYEAVMRSAARLTYHEVGKVLEGDTTHFRYPELIPSLTNLHELFKLLLKKRQKRGAINFETVETKIVFDAQHKIERIVAVHRNDAHKLIEEMMLAANVATAEWLSAHEMPALYRNHDGPDAEKLSDLRAFLGRLGLSLEGGDEPQAIHYAKLCERTAMRPDARLIHTVLLRSMRLAMYSPENLGHFGLAYPAYTHFTSPIRRYPDLVVHRAIKHILRQQPITKFTYSENELEILGEHCSMTERRADEATRDVVTWLKCEYMEHKIGEEFDGLVTAVTAFGLFVELDGVYVEGLVHVTSLPRDYYHFDPIGQCLRGERGGKIYRLSDKLRVRVVRVNLEDRKIDFELI